MTNLFVHTARDAARLCEPYFAGAAREKLVVLHLDAERRLLAVAIEEGGVGDVAIPVRALIADAVARRSAGLVLTHCHPSGDPAPSARDVEATRRLAEMARGLGIAITITWCSAAASAEAFGRWAYSRPGQTGISSGAGRSPMAANCAK